MPISTTTFIRKIFSPAPVLSSHGIRMAELNLQSRHELDGSKKQVVYEKLNALKKNLPRPQMYHLSRTSKDVAKAMSSVAFGAVVIIESAALIAVAVGIAGALSSWQLFLVPAMIIPMVYVLHSIMQVRQKRHAKSDEAKFIDVRPKPMPKSDRAQVLRASMDSTKYFSSWELPRSCMSARFPFFEKDKLNPAEATYAEFGSGSDFMRHSCVVGLKYNERTTNIMVELHAGKMMPLVAKGVYDHLSKGIDYLLQPTSSTQVKRAIDAALVFKVPEKIIEIVGTSHGTSSGHGCHNFGDEPDSGKVSITGSLIEAGHLHCFSAGSIKSVVVSSGQLYDLTPDIQCGANAVDASAGFSFGPAYEKKRKGLTIASAPHAQVAGGILMNYNAAMAKALGDDTLAAYVGSIEQGADLDGEALHLLMEAKENLPKDVDLDSDSDQLPCLMLVRL